MNLIKYIKTTSRLLLSLMVVGAFVMSCDEDDATGHSKLVPSNPTISMANVGSIAAISDEVDGTHVIDVTMSAAQIVDIAVHVFQTKGDAVEGEDFSLSTSRLVIPAGETTGSITVTILADGVIENSETFTLQIGDERTANATITPVTADFTISNYEDGDLLVSLEWGTADPVFDREGDEMDPTDIADLRLLIVDASNPFYTVEYDNADGGSFEEYTLEDALWADGTYYIAADFYAAVDLGDGGNIDLDLTAGFDQAGVQAESFSFSAALNTNPDALCALNYFIIASITKVGSTYTITEIGSKPATPDLSGTYDVVSNGDNTDGQPAAVNVLATVTLTDNGDGTYTISDGGAGVYQFWYCAPYGACSDVPVTLSRDDCGGLTGSGTGPFGEPVDVTGTDNNDGTMDISWVNGFDDFADAVYTIQ